VHGLLVLGHHVKFSKV